MTGVIPVENYSIIFVILEEEKKKKIDSAGQDFTPNIYNRSNYKTVQVRVKISQIRDVDTPFRRKNPDHVKSLKENMMDPRIGFDHAKGALSVTLQENDFADNYNIHTVVSRVEETPGYVIPADRTVSIVDGRHRRESVTQISKMVSEQFDWSRDYFDIVLQYRRTFRLCLLGKYSC